MSTFRQISDFNSWNDPYSYLLALVFAAIQSSQTLAEQLLLHLRRMDAGNTLIPPDLRHRTKRASCRTESSTSLYVRASPLRKRVESLNGRRE
jgi:hypothetical protein